MFKTTTFDGIINEKVRRGTKVSDVREKIRLLKPDAAYL